MSTFDMYWTLLRIETKEILPRSKFKFIGLVIST